MNNISCGIGYFNEQYYHFVQNGTVTPIKNTSETAQPTTGKNQSDSDTLFIMLDGEALNNISGCSFYGSSMYATASNKIVSISFNDGSFIATSVTNVSTTNVIFSKNQMPNCIYAMNSKSITSCCGSVCQQLKDQNINNEFITAVSTRNNQIYRIDDSTVLSILNIKDDTATKLSYTLIDLGLSKSPSRVISSLNSDETKIYVFDMNSKKLQYIDINQDQSYKVTGIEINTTAMVSAALFHDSNLVRVDSSGNLQKDLLPDLYVPRSANTAAGSPTSSPTSEPIQPTQPTQPAQHSEAINPAVAGGFTVLGIFLGMFIAAASFYLKRCRRRRNKREEYLNNSDTTTSVNHDVLSDKTPVDEVFYHDHLPIKNSFEVQILNGPSNQSNPIQTSISPIFSGRCNIKDFEAAKPSTNPRVREELYQRECTYNGKPGLIHYLSSRDKVKFNNGVQVLSAIQKLSYKQSHMLQLYDAFEFTVPSPDEYKMQFVFITSYYEPQESLANLYTKFRNGTTVVNVKDETFIICTIYSLLKSVRDLHKTGYVHQCLSIYSFYAESYAPTLDWILSDYHNAKKVMESIHANVLGTNNYMTKKNIVDFQNDIYNLGCIIYTVITGGRDFSTDSLQGMNPNIIQEVTENQRNNEQYRKLLNVMLTRDINQCQSAENIVKLWESFFDFNN